VFIIVGKGEERGEFMKPGFVHAAKRPLPRSFQATADTGPAGHCDRHIDESALSREDNGAFPGFRVGCRCAVALEWLVAWHGLEADTAAHRIGLEVFLVRQRSAPGERPARLRLGHFVAFHGESPLSIKTRVLQRSW